MSHSSVSLSVILNLASYGTKTGKNYPTHEKYSSAQFFTIFATLISLSFSICYYRQKTKVAHKKQLVSLKKQNCETV